MDQDKLSPLRIPFPSALGHADNTSDDIKKPEHIHGYTSASTALLVALFGCTRVHLTTCWLCLHPDVWQVILKWLCTNYSLHAGNLSQKGMMGFSVV